MWTLFVELLYSLPVPTISPPCYPLPQKAPQIVDFCNNAFVCGRVKQAYTLELELVMSRCQKVPEKLKYSGILPPNLFDQVPFITFKYIYLGCRTAYRLTKHVRTEHIRFLQKINKHLRPRPYNKPHTSSFMSSVQKCL